MCPIYCCPGVVVVVCVFAGLERVVALFGVVVLRTRLECVAVDEVVPAEGEGDRAPGVAVEFMDSGVMDPGVIEPGVVEPGMDDPGMALPGAVDPGVGDVIDPGAVVAGPAGEVGIPVAPPGEAPV